MKNLLLIFTFAITNLVIPYAHSKDEVPKEMKDATQLFIAASGYSCKSIDSIIPLRNGDYRVVCNDWKYVYIIKDKGGNYIVTLDD